MTQQAAIGAEVLVQADQISTHRGGQKTTRTMKVLCRVVDWYADFGNLRYVVEPVGGEGFWVVDSKKVETKGRLRN